MTDRHARRWSCRYSSCEYLHLDLIPGEAQGAGEVRLFLDHAPDRAERWTFAQVLAGGPAIDRLDAELRTLFGPDVPADLRAAIAADTARQRLSEEEEKTRDRIRRRQEGRAPRPGTAPPA